MECNRRQQSMSVTFCFHCNRLVVEFDCGSGIIPFEHEVSRLHFLRYITNAPFVFSKCISKEDLE